MIIIKYQWLLEHQNLEEEISLLKWKIRKSELELLRWTAGDLKDVKLERDSLSSGLEENIKRDKDLLNEKEVAMDNLMMMINQFKGLDNKILKMKYIDQLTIEQIAEELCYSSSHIYKRHAEIVRTINFVESLED